MISAQSHQSRRVLGRLDRGTELIKGITDLCAAVKVRSGEFRASGWLEEAELREYDQKSRSMRTRAVATPVQLLSLTGTVAEQDGALSVSAHAVLSRETDNGIQVLGGVIGSARVFLVELIIDAFDDLIVRRGIEMKTGAVAWTEIIEVPAPPESALSDDELERATRPDPDVSVPMAVKEARIQVMKDAQTKASPVAQSVASAQTFVSAQTSAGGPDKPLRAQDPFGLKGASGGPSPLVPPAAPRPAPTPVAPVTAASAAAEWEAVKAASVAKQDAMEDEAELETGLNPPKPGDVVEHTTFGRCTIEKVEMDLDRVSVRVRSGRLVQLSLEYLSLEPAGRQGGVRLFKAVKRR